jgi:hypothetical protein
MGSDIIKWPPSRLGRIDEPSPGTVSIEPAMGSEFRENGFSDGAAFQEFFRAQHLGVGPAVIGGAEAFSALCCGMQHRLSAGQIDCHRFFTDNMLPRPEGLNRLRRVKEYRRSDVDNMYGWIEKSFFEGSPDPDTVGQSLRRIPGHDPVQTATRFRLNGRNDALPGDVTNPDHKPIKHPSSVSKTYALINLDRRLVVIVLPQVELLNLNRNQSPWPFELPSGHEIVQVRVLQVQQIGVFPF